MEMPGTDLSEGETFSQCPVWKGAEMEPMASGLHEAGRKKEGV